MQGQAVPLLGQTRAAEAFASVLRKCLVPNEYLPFVCVCVNDLLWQCRELGTLPAVPLAAISYAAIRSSLAQPRCVSACYGTVRTFFVAYLPRVPPIDISATPRYWPGSVGEYEQTLPVAAVPGTSTHALAEFARFCHFEL